MIWRLVYWVNGGTQGWSESTFWSDNQNNPSAFKNQVEALLAKRATMLGNPFQIVAYRVTAYSTNAGARPPGRLKFFKRGAWPNPVNALFGAEPGNVGVALQMFDQTGGKTTQFTLGGPPDPALDVGGGVVLGQANFGVNADAFISQLTAAGGTGNDQWGWAQVGTPFTSDLASILNVSVTGIVTFATADAIPGTFVHGVKYPGRIAGVNSGRSSFNGQLLVRVVTYTGGPAPVEAWQTVKPIAFAGAPIGGHISVYPELRQFVRYNSGNVVLQSVKHRRGKPFGLSRGRKPARARA